MPPKLKKEDVVGLRYRMNGGYYGTIIDYENIKEVTIKLDSGFVKKTTLANIQRGSVYDPFFPTVYGVGCLGIDKYNKDFIIDEKIYRKAYTFWNGMLRRCYDEKWIIEKPTYKGCVVCDEWHCFKNFLVWFEDSYYEIDGEKMCLDKDILVKGNKVYSPETCVFVPNSINGLFTKRQNDRGSYPLGVVYDKNAVANPFVASYEGFDKSVSCGRYGTPEEAFFAYKKGKEFHIKEVADLYKDAIPQKLYDAMYEYEVEITD